MASTDEAVPQILYFDNDFEADEWILECQAKPLPPIVMEEAIDEASQWDAFFHTHIGGQFFKPRKYVYPAYQKWIENSKVCLEVGCGHGCSIYPLIDNNQLLEIRMIATDYSSEALSIFMLHDKFDPSRIDVRLWDITQPYTASTDFRTVNNLATTKEDVDCREIFPSPSLPENEKRIHGESADTILCLFVLSALHSDTHESALQHMWKLLPPGGVVLFRDYGICDMTMFRHRSRLTENLYRRSDGTLSYYFDLDYVRDLCSAVGFEPVELKYATVQITNKKKGITMRRVFVHAVLVKRV